ncbi:HEPN domain-containing protein [Azorhizobium oxalatiphilum]|uniref:HEPN domain-containing protein n=1 Tax=Azorhizobium oxalatiphilum TaxID=980631 RepID=A0A917BRU6_9HYPH|nr:HEPN domain-containing protein [Azorhizobium oxalatiphilum]GGF54549.1 HEPN domain-containing protein [Azorhizobium oxalatiphilum]
MDSVLWLKALEALDVAVLALEREKYDSACNRAYYAMFCAARVALERVGAPPRAVAAKTHVGTILSFTRHVVEAGHVPAEIGRLLSVSQQMRLIADYDADEMADAEDARKAVEDARLFLEAVRRMA